MPKVSVIMPAFNRDWIIGRAIDSVVSQMNVVMHRASLLEEVGYFDEKLQRLQDWDLFIRFALRYPFGIKLVDQVLCDYYYYLPEAAETITNKRFGETLRDQFGMGEIVDLSHQRIVRKIATAKRHLNG